MKAKAKGEADSQTVRSAVTLEDLQKSLDVLISYVIMSLWVPQ